MSIITIIGAGMMGSALSIPAKDNGHTVRIVGTPLDREIIASLREKDYHPTMKRTLPHCEYYDVEQMQEAMEGCDYIIGGVSSFGVDWFARTVLPLLKPEVPVLSVTKGLLNLPDGSLLPFPEYYSSLRPDVRFNAIGGPCTSYELADRHQTMVVFCGKDHDTLCELRSLMQTDYYHINVSTDIMGVECAVAMKNAYALAVSLTIGQNEAKNGMDAPLDYNGQAALFAQSIREMRRILTITGGGDDNIVYGAGDLYVTIFGGRTRRIGTLLGRGLSYEEAMEQLNGVTLESIVIASRVAAAFRVQAAQGKVALHDFPMLMHVDDLIHNGCAVSIPWDQFII